MNKDRVTDEKAEEVWKRLQDLDYYKRVGEHRKCCLSIPVRDKTDHRVYPKEIGEE